MIYFGPSVVFPFDAQIQCESNKRPADTDHQTHAAATLTLRPQMQSQSLRQPVFQKKEEEKKLFIFSRPIPSRVQGNHFKQLLHKALFAEICTTSNNI